MGVQILGYSMENNETLTISSTVSYPDHSHWPLLFQTQGSHVNRTPHSPLVLGRASPGLMSRTVCQWVSDRSIGVRFTRSVKQFPQSVLETETIRLTSLGLVREVARDPNEQV